MLTENEPLAREASLSMQAMATNSHLKNIRGSQLGGNANIKNIGKNGTRSIDIAALIGKKSETWGIKIIYNPNDLSKTRLHVRAPAAQIQRVGPHSFFDTRYKQYKQVVLSRCGINAADTENKKLTKPGEIVQAATAKQDFWILVSATFYGYNDDLTRVIKGDADTNYCWPKDKLEWKQCWLHNVKEMYPLQVYDELALFCEEIFNKDLEIFRMYNGHFVHKNKRYEKGVTKFHQMWNVRSEWVIKYGGYGPVNNQSTFDDLTFLGEKFSFYVFLISCVFWVCFELYVFESLSFSCRLFCVYT